MVYGIQILSVTILNVKMDHAMGSSLELMLQIDFVTYWAHAAQFLEFLWFKSCIIIANLDMNLPFSRSSTQTRNYRDVFHIFIQLSPKSCSLFSYLLCGTNCKLAA